MANLDKILINFSEEHELDSILKKNNKRGTAENRKILVELGKECKKSLNKRVLKHTDLDEFFKKNPKLLEKLEGK